MKIDYEYDVKTGRYMWSLYGHTYMTGSGGRGLWGTDDTTQRGKWDLLNDNFVIPVGSSSNRVTAILFDEFFFGETHSQYVL